MKLHSFVLVSTGDHPYITSAKGWRWEGWVKKIAILADVQYILFLIDVLITVLPLVGGLGGHGGI